MGSQQSVFTEEELQLYQVLRKLAEAWAVGSRRLAVFDYAIKLHFHVTINVFLIVCQLYKQKVIIIVILTFFF